MDYSTLVKHVTQLSMDHKLLNDIQAVTVTYQQQSFDQPNEMLAAIAQLGEVTGWVTWPDKVEPIETPRLLLAEVTMPPLEGELVTVSPNKQDQHYIRLNYRDQGWHLIRITMQVPKDAAEANALADPMQLAFRNKEQVSLGYARIWQMDEHQGVINTDAIFTGFAGGEL